MEGAAGVFHGGTRKHDDAFAVGGHVEILLHVDPADLSGRPHVRCSSAERIALRAEAGGHDAVVAPQKQQFVRLAYL